MVISSVTNPLRFDILESLGASGTATVRELSERIGRPRSTVRDHLAELNEFGLVEVVEEREQRGARERVYRINRARAVIGEEQMAAVSQQEVRRVHLAIVRRMFDSITRAVRHATSTARPDHVFCWSVGRVDEEGWKQLAALHDRTSEVVQRVLDESETRLAASGEDAIPVATGEICLEMPPADARDEIA